jgi:hypothetical protein
LVRCKLAVDECILLRGRRSELNFRIRTFHSELRT